MLQQDNKISFLTLLHNNFSSSDFLFEQNKRQVCINICHVQNENNDAGQKFRINSHTHTDNKFKHHSLFCCNYLISIPSPFLSIFTTF